MEYLKIKNWDRWQTYRKDRGQPPWIKIHRCVMRNPEWVSLTDAERGQLVAMWLLAADHDGVIPASPDVIQKLCFMQYSPNLNKFTDLGFIEDGWRQDGVKMASSGRQHDAPKAEKNSTDTGCQGDAKVTPKELFEVFYNSYPKKRKRGDAEKAWRALKITEKLSEEIMAGLELANKSKDWNKDDGKFIPYPATWLRGKGWLDEYGQENEKPEWY